MQPSNAPVSPTTKSKYENIARRRGKKRAIIAIARMILTAIYHMFKTGEVFCPTDLRQIDMPEELKEKHRLRKIHNAIQLLKRQGILTELLLPHPAHSSNSMP